MARERLYRLALMASVASELEELVSSDPERYGVDLEALRDVRRYYYREFVKEVLRVAGVV